jgi:hypothetical protein
LAALDKRPGQTRDELRVTTGLSGANVAQNLRRLMEQGQIVERALPDGGTGFALATSTSETVEQGPAGGDSSSRVLEPQASMPSPEDTPPEAQADSPASAEVARQSAQAEGEADAASSPPRSRRARTTSTRSPAKRAGKPAQSQLAATDDQDGPAVTDELAARDTRETDTPDSTGTAS